MAPPDESKEPMTIETATSNIKETVNQLIAQNKSDVLKAVDESFPKEVTKTSLTETLSKDKMKWLFWVILIVLLMSAYGLTVRSNAIDVALKPTDSTGSAPFDIKTQLACLGFIVALASYLASVAREIVKKLPEEREGSKEYTKLKRSIAYIVIGEIHIVLLGLVFLFRIVAGSFFLPVPGSNNSPVSGDKFLMANLVVIVCYLAGNHARIWLMHKPWAFKSNVG